MRSNDMQFLGEAHIIHIHDLAFEVADMRIEVLECLVPCVEGVPEEGEEDEGGVTRGFEDVVPVDGAAGGEDAGMQRFGAGGVFLGG